MDRIEQAVDTFSQGFSCSQAVCSAFADEFGLEHELAMKISCAFGGGMAQMGETCGAVTGAFMVIGLKYGRVDVDDLDAKAKTYAKVKQFVALFSERQPSIKCKEILGVDMNTERGSELVKELQIPTQVCPQVVRDAANVLQEILRDE